MDNVILLLILLNIVMITTNVLILVFGARLLAQGERVEEKLDQQSRFLMFMDQRREARDSGC